jgi:hypothetical protein
MMSAEKQTFASGANKDSKIASRSTRAPEIGDWMY